MWVRFPPLAPEDDNGPKRLASAARSKSAAIKIAGKTGTAQITTPEGIKNVAWFIAFAPVENPDIAVAIALEGNEPNVEYAGAQHAAPIARELLGTYFDKQAKR